MKTYQLFTPAFIGGVALQNHIVMAPMTRCRAIDNIPNQLMAQFYGQRASAGLIITEGTSPSINGLGYARIPGVFTKEQVAGWRLITSAVHKGGAKIILQLMHTGRISHPLNMSDEAQILAPSAIKAAGQMWTDAAKLQDYPIPKEMTTNDIILTKAEYVTAAINAIEAGFDGVELHGANGYLLEEFLSQVTNKRKDNYGGNIANRCRFVIEVATAVANAIGKNKTGIRLSPYGVASDMPLYPEIEATYNYLSLQFNNLDIAYIHIVDHSSMGSPSVPLAIKQLIRKNFKNTIILCGGYNKERAEADIESGLCNLVAFGRPYINNPDLVQRFQNNWTLAALPTMDLFYTPGENGYTNFAIHPTH